MISGRDTLRCIEEVIIGELAAFLKRELPGISGKEWWRISVINLLRDQYQESARSFGEGEVERLDLNSLVYVTSANWKALSGAIGTRQSITSYLHIIREFRNKVVHDRGCMFEAVDLDHVIQSAIYVVRTVAPNSASIQKLHEESARIHLLLDSPAETAPDAEAAGSAPSADDASSGESRPAETILQEASPPPSGQAKPVSWRRRTVIAGGFAAVAAVCVAAWFFLKPDSTPMQEFSASVIRVVDGDTIEVLNDSQETAVVQIAGIDAPEPKQPYGTESAAALSALVANSQVKLRIVAIDRYKRPIALVERDGADVGEALIRSGGAWVYRKYLSGLPKEFRSRYTQAEEDARTAGRGLWAQPEPTAPWDWRHSFGRNSK